MRKPSLRFVLVAGALLAACTGSVEDDLKKSGAELRKQAESMSADDLQARIDELAKYSEKLQKEVGEGEPTEAQMAKMAKVVEVSGIYAVALANKQIK